MSSVSNAAENIEVAKNAVQRIRGQSYFNIFSSRSTRRGVWKTESWQKNMEVFDECTVLLATDRHLRLLILLCTCLWTTDRLFVLIDYNVAYKLHLHAAWFYPDSLAGFPSTSDSGFPSNNRHGFAHRIDCASLQAFEETSSSRLVREISFDVPFRDSSHDITRPRIEFVLVLAFD